MNHVHEADLIEPAVERLHAATGLVAEILPLVEGAPGRPDGRIRVKHKGRWITFWVEVKARVDRVATLQQVQDRLKLLDGPGLLLAPYLTPEMTRRCQEMGLPFLDAAGNAFLVDEGLFVLVTGNKPGKTLTRPERPTRAFEKAGLRVVFVLLVEPRLLNAPYREIARAAGVALGTIGTILGDLKEHGFLVEDRQGARHWVDRERAVQAWTTNFPLRLRGTLQPRRFRPANEDWWKDTEPQVFGGFWGGEVAAAELTRELVPKTVTIYLKGDRNRFLTAHRMKADPRGLVEVLDAFWNLPEPRTDLPWLVPPLLVYADLEGIGDPRTLEQARLIHDQHLA